MLNHAGKLVFERSVYNDDDEDEESVIVCCYISIERWEPTRVCLYNMFIVIILFSRIIFIFLSRPSLTLQNVRIPLAPQRNPDRGRSSLESHYESEN